MLIWGAAWGAMLGLLWPGWGGEFYAIGGGFMGLAAGYTLRRAVRTVVRQEMAAAAWARPQSSTAPVRAADAVATDWAATEPLPRTSPAAADHAADAESAWEPAAGHAAGPTAGTAASARASREEDQEFDDFFAGTRPTDAIALDRVGEVAPRPPALPPTPSPLERGVTAVRDWFLGGNPIVRAGLVILFIGLSFLARYAAQAGFFPVELRLAAIGAVGIALLAIGFRQREAKPAFGLLLQGGGVAALYLTVFAAFRLYQLVPQLLAFGLMVAVCALSCALALLQNARSLAFAAFAGGFATPLLLSTGGGSHVALFSYFTVLNLAILFIATRRAWRELNLLGFIATFGVATLWGVLRYEAAHYASAQVFLAIFTAIFIATAILYARAAPASAGWNRGRAVDTSLVFGTPLAAFGLQMGLVQPYLYGEAFSALAFGAVYLVLAAGLLRGADAGYRLLIECFLAMGVGFVTLAVPLALDAQWTSAVWALEGAGAFWVGRRQGRWMPRAFGLLLQGFALLGYLDAGHTPLAAWPLAHAGFLGATLIAMAALAIAWWSRRPLPHSDSRWARQYALLEALLPTPLLLYGVLMWLQGWAQEFRRLVPAAVKGQFALPAWSDGLAIWGMAGVTLLSFAALLQWALRARWAVAAWPSRASLGVLAFALLAQWDMGLRVTDWPCWLAWPLALALHGWLLQRNERAGGDLLTPPWARWLNWQHIGTVWLLVLLLGDALLAWADRAQLWGTAWVSVTGVVAGMAVLVALTLWAGRGNDADKRVALRWPLNPHAEAYYWWAALPLAVLLWLGAFALAWTSSGRTDPLPYIPVLNPTDLAVLLAMGAILLWRQRVLAADPRPMGAHGLRGAAFWGGMGVLGLVVLSTVWLRIAHHYFGVPWNAYALYHSFVVQTGYAILWTLTALALMVVAHRRGLRPAWLAGAALLALVIAKLILVDLSNRGGGERIIAFIGVGVLMLVVGYLAPLPPKRVTGQGVRA